MDGPSRRPRKLCRREAEKCSCIFGISDVMSVRSFAQQNPKAGWPLQRMNAQMPRAQERSRAAFWLLFFGHPKKSNPPEARYIHRD